VLIKGGPSIVCRGANSFYGQAIINKQIVTQNCGLPGHKRKIVAIWNLAGRSWRRTPTVGCSTPLESTRLGSSGNLHGLSILRFSQCQLCGPTLSSFYWQWPNGAHNCRKSRPEENPAGKPVWICYCHGIVVVLGLGWLRLSVQFGSVGFGDGLWDGDTDWD